MQFNYVIDASVVVEIALKTIPELRFEVRYIESRKYAVDGRGEIQNYRDGFVYGESRRLTLRRKKRGQAI